MKRTLLETLAGLAVLVLLASFHHQISRLRSQTGEVAELRSMVQEAVQDAGAAEDGGELNAVRAQLMAQLETRLGELETAIAEAAARGEEAERLREELAATKREATRFQAEIARDVSRTMDLVDAYHREVRALDRSAKESLFQAKTHLRDLAQRVAPDPTLLNDELLSPTVQLNGDDTVGSGTLVHSAKRADTGSIESYVLTSYHVVRNILADTPSARRLGISVTIYTGDGKVEERADMVSHDERIDAALLQLRSDKLYEKVARVLPRDRAHRVQVWEGVWAVGCPLGNDPIPTRGEVSSTRNRLGGANYWMVNAPTYFGNSGGGIYLADTRELCGVFSKIYTHGKGNPVVVPHMGLCTPMDSIYEWLDEAELAFVLERTEAEADELELDPSMLAAPAPR